MREMREGGNPDKGSRETLNEGKAEEGDPDLSGM